MNDRYTRREVMKMAGAGAIALSAMPEAFSQGVAEKEYALYVGTYTSGNSQGIYRLRYNSGTGELSGLELAAKTLNPSYLAFSPDFRHLYAVSEIGNFEGKRSGGVGAFSVEPGTGKLNLLNQQATLGGAPCYVSVNRTAKWVLAANYSGGNVAVLPIQQDGSLGEVSDTVQHKGSSVNPQRQKEPHAHCIVLSPDGSRAYAADLGIDKVMIYRLDAEQGKLIANEPAFYQTEPGAGPRHFTFHPNGKLAFVILELNSTLSSLSYDPETGALERIETVSTLPEGFNGDNSCADIHVAPSGKFVYGSNRGHDSIAIFAVDEKTGKLTPVGHESTRGKTPRNFTLDPAGRFLLAANQNTNNVTVFAVDEESGELDFVQEVEVPVPVCLKFMPLDQSGITGS